MSRLTRLEDRRNLRKAVLFGLGTVGLIGLLMLLGIPILVRMAIFLGDVKSSGRPVDRSDIIPPAPPQIRMAYEATNSAQIDILGYSEPGAIVYLTDNGESVGNVVTTENGSFSFSDTALTSGDNAFTAIAVDQAGNKSQTSEEETVYFSNKAPDLTVGVGTPAEGKVEIKGATNGTRLVVNDRLVILGAGGKFQTLISVPSGESTLVFVATDRAGNQTKKEVKISTP